MDSAEIQRLRFRRQYLISADTIECPFLHNKTILNERYVLYSHIDLPLTNFKKDDIHLFLMGDIFDATGSQKNNKDILGDIVHHDFNVLVKNLIPYSGRFVLIYVKQKELFIVHDPSASRKIFYGRAGTGYACASQSHLLAEIAKFDPTEDPSKLSYYGSQEFQALYNANVGNSTYYDEIQQVLPNHYLNFINGEVSRFWPIEKRMEISLKECIDICTELTKGYVDSIATRYKVMLPVTSGKDSRTLLAATTDIRNESFYYINREKRLTKKSNDIKIPTSLFKQLGLDYHVLQTDLSVDEDFKKVYFENNRFATGRFLPIIYNYYVNFSDRVNLPGHIATGAALDYPIYKRTITADALLKLNKLEKYEHARKLYSEWLDNSLEYCKRTNYNIFDLFYWEERLGNWGTQIQLDKDIAQEEFNPFNSRLLVQTILSIKQAYIVDYEKYQLNKGIINNLWPEVLSQPINPGWKNDFFSILDFFGVKGLFYRLWFR